MIKVTNKENNMPIPTNRQSGVAAIFVVVFFTLLISIIVLSFVQIVNQDQRQATNADLSSSAYDSAQAGVEDAKRGLELYKKECSPVTPACVNKYISTDPAAPGALSGENCTIFQDKLGSDLGLIADSGGEVKIATNTSSGSNDKALDQAYTCLKVNLYPTDYKRSLDNGNTILFPLKAVAGAQPASVKLTWFDKSQFNKDPSNLTPLDIPNATSNFNLPTGHSTTDWPGIRPPVMRVQVIAIQQGVPINMDTVDRDSRVVFLYPSTKGQPSVDIKFADPVRSFPKFSPVAAKCIDSLAGNPTYACSVKITGITPPAGVNYDYYLRLTAIYNGANLQVQMLDGPGVPLKFDGVQPEIDSTGRTSDVFRRVISRVSFDADTSGVDVTQGICKNFELADGSTYYKSDCGGHTGLVD